MTSPTLPLPDSPARVKRPHPAPITHARKPRRLTQPGSPGNHATNPGQSPKTPINEGDPCLTPTNLPLRKSKTSNGRLTSPGPSWMTQDVCSGLSPRVVRRRRRLLTAPGCEPEQALRRSRVAAASPREAALLLPRRQLRAAPTLASSRGCTGLARAARPVVLVRSGHPAPSSIDARFASGEQQLGHPVQQIRGVPVIRQPGACRVRWTLPAAWVNLRVAAPRANC